MIDPLMAISPLDGRYREKVTHLEKYFSEWALMKYRVLVEIEWFLFLCNKAKLPGTKVLSKREEGICRALYEDFDLMDGKRIKTFEEKTNHDVKAVEYFIREHFKAYPKLGALSEFIHFGCTSEDINNLAYALMLRDFGDKEFTPLLTGLLEALYGLAKKYAEVPMLARTHGQAASPTTMGKEVMNFVARLDRQLFLLRKQEICAKFNGAVGNFNAHMAAYPKLDWQKLTREFLNSFERISVESYTTQIEPHDYLAEIFDHVARINIILIDLSRDIWMYISFGYFRQKLKEGEIGSSTMPHKVNPIDFENAEGNLGLSNAVYRHLADKLPVSRLQRDLTDSTVMRNIGVSFGYSILAYKSLLKGLSKIEIDREHLKRHLDCHWEVLAEAIQTVLRKYKVSGAYEKLKELSRGKSLSEKEIKRFISQLKIPEADKKHLLRLSPQTYTGLAKKLTLSYKPYFIK